MDNPQEQPRQVEETEKQKAEKKAKLVGVNFWKAFKWCAIFSGCACVVFFWQQWKSLGFSYPIDYNLFGTLGDFIGGVLGTIIAFYSVYLLVRTFQNQIETNASVTTTNESVVQVNNDVIATNKKLIQQSQLQIFDSRFNTLLNLYHKAVESYSEGDLKGRDCFERYALDFKNSGYENHTEYKRRSLGAVSEYLVLYANHRRGLSVHYRMLYLLSRLTAEEKMRENYRVTYAKSIRGQLSEGELLLLRYNCLAPYGQKMCQYVNQFNLLKHLPIMSLLEFTYWRKMVKDEDKISSIDQLALSLKKLMTKMLDKEGSNEEKIDLSSRYKINLKVSDTHDSFEVRLNKSKKKIKGGAIKRPVEEGALDNIVESELATFMKEVLIELFVYSNFFMFNGDNHNIVSSETEEDDDKHLTVVTRVSRPGIALALAQSQVMPSMEPTA
jgi:hypothetical protein